MLPYGFLHLMLPRGLISFADRPRHQLEINLIANILSWTIGQLWIHHKILMSTNAPTSRFGFASFWCKEDEAWSILSFFFFIYINFFYFNNGLGFTGTQGFHLSAIWASFIQCCILQLCHPRYLFIALPYRGHPFFWNTGASLSRAWSHASPP